MFSLCNGILDYDCFISVIMLRHVLDLCVMELSFLVIPLLFCVVGVVKFFVYRLPVALYVMDLECLRG